MYRLKIIDYFSAAHQLDGYRGKCEALHGHNWKVEAHVRGEELDDVGLLIDFGVLKQHLQDILEQLDHKFLNSLPELQGISPSSELLARHIFQKLKARLPAGLALDGITVWESEQACAAYSE